MSFGFSIGDLIAVTSIVRRICESCRVAPQEFKEVVNELDSLQIALCDLEHDYTPALSDKSTRVLEVIKDCAAALRELEEYVKTHKLQKSIANKGRRKGTSHRWRVFCFDTIFADTSSCPLKPDDEELSIDSGGDRAQNHTREFGLEGKKDARVEKVYVWTNASHMQTHLSTHIAKLRRSTSDLQQILQVVRDKRGYQRKEDAHSANNEQDLQTTNKAKLSPVALLALAAAWAPRVGVIFLFFFSCFLFVVSCEVTTLGGHGAWSLNHVSEISPSL